jgi:hypothetical protein
MNLKKLKQSLLLLISFTLMSSTTFAASTLDINQSINLYNYQLDSGTVSIQEAELTLKNNIKSLLNSGMSVSEIQNTLVTALPADLQTSFGVGLEALVAQGATESEIINFTQEIVMENDVTGVAFSGGSTMRTGRYVLIVAVIGVAVYLYLNNQDDDSTDTDESHGGNGAEKSYDVM